MKAVQHMGSLPVGKLLIRYSIPAIIGFVANALYQFVDRILVGRGVGTLGVAAVTAAYPLSLVAMSLGLLVGTGTGNRIPMLLGQGDREGAERVLGQGVRMALWNGGILALLTWVFTKPLLLACGCAPELLPLAIPFARISAVGQIFLIVLISMGNILRVQGRPLTGLCIMLSSNVLNVGLAWTAIYGLHLGVTGTAIATSLAQAAGCLAVLAFVQGPSSALRVRARFLRADRPLAKTILALGAPFGLMQLFGTLTFLAANHGAAGQGGTVGIATLGVLNTVSMLLIYPSLGIMQAMQPLLGFNKGAGRLDRVYALLGRGLVSTLLLGAGFSAIVVFFPGQVAGLFSKSDPELVAMVRAGLPFFVLPVIFFGLEGTMSHYFLSMQVPRKAGLLLLGRQVLAIPLFLVLPRLFGFRAMYYVAPLASLPFATLALVFMVRELSVLRRSRSAR